MGQKKKTGVSPKTIKWIWYAAFAPFALVALMLVLTVFGVFGRMPSFEELENPRSNLATEIYSEDGKVITNGKAMEMVWEEPLLCAVRRPLSVGFDASHPAGRA